MKQKIQKQTEKEILKNFPIKDEVPGWYFRSDEISNGAWLVEGCDQWGRKVSAQGNDPEELLKQVALQAVKINKRISSS